jgi:hypothetical protein
MYSPLSLVLEERENPVAGAVMVTFAPGTAEPVESVTVPEMLPVACPYRIEAARNVSKQTAAIRGEILMSIESPIHDCLQPMVRAYHDCLLYVLLLPRAVIILRLNTHGSIFIQPATD